LSNTSSRRESSVSTVAFESEHVMVTADEALAADRDVETRTAKEEAEDFLASILAEGPQPVRKIEEEARAAGLLGSEQDIGQSKPFRLARSALGIKPRQPRGDKAGGWVWELPATYQMPSGYQMPSQEKASDRERASDPADASPPPSAGVEVCAQCGAADPGPLLHVLTPTEGEARLHPECRRFWLRDHPQPRGSIIPCVDISEIPAMGARQ
jgi:hypothetical protein